jgi:hypothetical protein
MSVTLTRELRDKLHYAPQGLTDFGILGRHAYEQYQAMSWQEREHVYRLIERMGLDPVEAIFHMDLNLSACYDGQGVQQIKMQRRQQMVAEAGLPAFYANARAWDCALIAVSQIMHAAGLAERHLPWSAVLQALDPVDWFNIVGGSTRDGEWMPGEIQTWDHHGFSAEMAVELKADGVQPADAAVWRELDVPVEQWAIWNGQFSAGAAALFVSVGFATPNDVAPWLACFTAERERAAATGRTLGRPGNLIYAPDKQVVRSYHEWADRTKAFDLFNVETKKTEHHRAYTGRRLGRYVEHDLAAAYRAAGLRPSQVVAYERRKRKGRGWGDLVTPHLYLPSPAALKAAWEGTSNPRVVRDRLAAGYRTRATTAKTTAARRQQRAVQERIAKRGTPEGHRLAQAEIARRERERRRTARAEEEETARERALRLAGKR